jgi:hypothetical protein
MRAETALDLLSQSTAVISLFALFYAGVPFKDASWKQSTPAEIEYPNRQWRFAWVVGFPAAVISVGCQTVKTLFFELPDDRYSLGPAASSAICFSISSATALSIGGSFLAPVSSTWRYEA